MQVCVASLFLFYLDSEYLSFGGSFFLRLWWYLKTARRGKKYKWWQQHDRFLKKFRHKTLNEPDISVYLLSDRIPPVFCGKKHLAQLLYHWPLVVAQHLVAKVGLQYLIVGLSLVLQGVWSFYRLQNCLAINVVFLIIN